MAEEQSPSIFSEPLDASMAACTITDPAAHELTTLLTTTTTPENVTVTIAVTTKPDEVVVADEVVVDMLSVNVKVNLGQSSLAGERAGSVPSEAMFTIQVPADGDISIYAVKDKLAAAVGVPAEMLYLEFMSQPLGRCHASDPLDEMEVLLSASSVTTWLAKFPAWYVICKLMPGTPVDPYVAIKRTVALQMGRDPDEEIAKATADGSLHHIDNWEEHKVRYGITD
mmetsp:Transcript_22680/g.37922  ORF Transcript_22680/g.37922 Transcript_22680/m.37922 type:complete len:226 (+) Transcript_22680:775-1452(+)